jgi:phage-related protein
MAPPIEVILRDDRRLQGSRFVYEAAGPVKYTPLHEWIERGKPYDFYFGWSDDRIYSSEFVSGLLVEVVNE